MTVLYYVSKEQGGKITIHVSDTVTNSSKFLEFVDVNDLIRTHIEVLSDIQQFRNLISLHCKFLEREIRGAPGFPKNDLLLAEVSGIRDIIEHIATLRECKLISGFTHEGHLVKSPVAIVAESDDQMIVASDNPTHSEQLP